MIDTADDATVLRILEVSHISFCEVSQAVVLIFLARLSIQLLD